MGMLSLGLYKIFVGGGSAGDSILFIWGKVIIKFKRKWDFFKSLVLWKCIYLSELKIVELHLG